MIAEMIAGLVSWPTLGLVIIVFGFAPGAVLRFVVLAFHPDDPRRQELLGELHAVPRVERPFWVAEQLEVAICEGLWGRFVWALTGRVIYRWHLGSGVERNRSHPDTFDIPPETVKDLLVPGDTVKLMFEMKDGWGERMWVQVTEIKGNHLVGILDSQPLGIPRLDSGDKVNFRREHIIDVLWPDNPLDDDPDDDLALRTSR